MPFSPSFILAAPALLLPAALAWTAEAPGFTPSHWLSFGQDPQTLARECRQAKDSAEARLKELAAIPDRDRTFANTPEALEKTLAELSDQTAADTFLKYVSLSSDVRDAGNDCESLVNQFKVEVLSREDLFSAINGYAKKEEPLEGEPRRLLEKELLDFKRNGLLLPASKRKEIKKIKKRLVELETQFSKNLNDVKDSLLVSRQELEGLAEDYIQRLPKEGGLYRVSVDYPDYFPFMENAKNSEARRKLEFLFNNRAAKENLPLLKEALRLRQKAARLLGYPSHADYVLEERMAKNSRSVREFLGNLRKRLEPLAQKELQELSAFKKQAEGASADPVLRAWDWRYYDNQLRKARYDVDKEKIKEYFPIETVLEGMLAVYQRLLGVKFHRIEGAALWNPDVKLYKISDASGGEPLAYFYMDLFPREGKYKHAAAFSLVSGRFLADGRYQKPVSAVVANFTKPSPGRPTFLKHGEHEEVETIFHEFGHIMHQTLTKARFARFSGSSVAWDFVEAPSQMLENWVWDPEVLSSLSGHYKDPSKKLPPELLEKMIASRHFNVGLVHSRQLLFASVDLGYHSRVPADTTALYARLMKDIALFPMSPGTHPEASFGHIMGGYDSGYYGYLWSKVYAQDLFSRFKSAGLLDLGTGLRYRREILEPGSGREEEESLKRFLGREPNNEAFLESLGLAPH
ncbi:MAG: Zn-dependent oligopeptidase [Elusimicrobia bacterium]|nr:Zn-dependent oligopeptidase [Elusimicrobiota bacterium]